MQTRCPHCHNPIEIVEGTCLAELSCPSCGSKFSLISAETTIATRGEGQRQIDRFALIEQVGAGAFGSVWKARDTELDRIVAVKIPRREQLSATESELFLREARAAAQLRHPHIVGMHEIGREHETVYLVSDFIQGCNLKEWLTARRLSAREAAELCVKLAEALHHAHEAGVIHRDLKPGNVLMDLDGQPHVTDFGLAKRESGEITMTVDGQILGTPAYMSPEQAAGKSHQVDRRSDIYALGVILFELLTGELPFRGEKQMLLVQILKDEPPSPRKLNGRIPRDLETICLKCLEKDPTRRYATAQSLADDLDLYLTGRSITSRPVGTPERAWRWCKRNPVVAGLTTVIATLLLVLTVGTSIAAVRFARLASDEKQARQAEEWQRKNAERLVSEKDRLAGQERVAAARAEESRRTTEITLADMYTSTGLIAGDRGNPAEAMLWFANAASLAKNDPQRALANRVRARMWSRLACKPLRAFVHESQKLTDLRFDPRGTHLMVLAEGEKCTIWDLQADRAVDWVGASESVWSADWSPDGKWLAVGAQGTVKVHEFPNGDVVKRLEQPGAVSALTFSRDGAYLAAAGRSVRVYDCREFQAITADLPHPAPVRHLVFNQPGDRLLTAGADGLSRLFEIPGSSAAAKPLITPLKNVGPHGNTARPIRPCFIDQDRGILTLAAANTVAWWDAATGKQTRVVPSGMNPTGYVAVGPDCRYLAMNGFGGVQFYNIATGQKAGAYMPHKNAVWQVAFSPDSQSLLSVCGDRTAKLWSVPSGRPLAPEIPHTGATECAAFSADGRFFATGQPGSLGLVRVWALPEGNPNEHRIQLEGSTTVVQLSPNGKHVIPTGHGAWRSQLQRTRVYEVATGAPAGKILEVGGMLMDGALSPDEQGAVTVCLPGGVSGSKTGEIQFWDWRSGKRCFDPLRMKTSIGKVAYSPDGKRLLALFLSGELVAIDTTTGKIAVQRQHALGPNGSFPGVRVAPDGNTLLTWGIDSAVHVWNPATLEPRYPPLKHKLYANDVTVSHDGRMMVVSGVDHASHIYDLQTGKALADSLNHPDWVFTGAFSPDLTQVLTSCRDGMARLWNWQTGELVCPAFKHDDEVFDATFTPDGQWILTASRDGTARLWEGHTGKPAGPPIQLGGQQFPALLRLQRAATQTSMAWHRRVVCL